MSDIDFNNMTETELLAALEDGLREARIATNNNEPGTITTTEIRKIFGIGRVKADKLTTRLIEQGKLKTDFVRRIDRWGVEKKVQGFRYIN